MDEAAEAALLGVDPTDLQAVRERFTEATYEGQIYRYLSSGFRGIERGTVSIEDTLVRGYPSIPRVLVLETGIPAYFEDRIAVEEKLNGFNVRIARVGEPYAFTRGGHICPYSTRMARELLDLDSFFEAHPEQMLCAEFIGPENPYTAHTYPDVDSVQPMIFDVRDRETGTPMPVDRRREIVDRHGLPQPELFGLHSPADAEIGRAHV